MQNGLIVVLAGVMALLILGVRRQSLAAEKETAPQETAATRSNAFGMELYQRLAENEKGNIFFSPASIETALAMTYAGAKGETLKQMAKALHLGEGGNEIHKDFGAWIGQLNKPAEIEEYHQVGQEMKAEKVPAYQLVVANALWGQANYAFKAEFAGLVADKYAGKLQTVDFGMGDAARKTINDWIAQQTKDRIKDMIPQGALPPDTRMVLTNAIYFKSSWAEEFHKAATKDGEFTLEGGKTAKVPLMHQTERCGYTETADYQALELAYKGDALSMVILLPRKVDGIAALEKSLTADGLDKLMPELKSERVDVTLPKWKFTSGLLKLGDDLQTMGMKDAFDAHKADFSGISSQEPLYIGEVLHKAFVAVDEEGTEAAAATAVVMRAGSVMRREEPKVFKADHPFVYVIRHRASGGILFMGRVANPSE